MVTTEVTLTPRSPNWIREAAHGSPRRRSSKPHTAATSWRTTIARPIVIITTAKTGLPTMRRRIVRSMAQPMPAMTTAASATEATNGSAVWLNAYTRYAPSNTSSPCAKLITCVAL